MGRVCTLADEAAFAELMQRWEQPMKRYLARMVLNSGDAEDLAQESFVRLYQQRARFDQGQPFAPWLYAIATNLARNRLRWWRRRPSIDLDSWTRNPCAAQVESVPGAAELLELAERARQVRLVVSELPVGLREVVVLCEFEELGQAEAARVLGTTQKAVEHRLSRARERLRTRLAALAQGERR